MLALRKIKAVSKRLAGFVAKRTLSPASYARYLGVRFGDGCRILTRNFGSEPFLIEMGNIVTISSDVSFINHDGSTWLARDEAGWRNHFAKIIIGNNVFVGARAILLPGVVIGDRVIVGAGSVVTKSVPSGYIVAGNPARIVGRFEDWERRTLAERPMFEHLRGLEREAAIMQMLVTKPRRTLEAPREG